MHAVSSALRDALVESYPGYVRTRLADCAASEVDRAISEGAAWLERQLDELLVLPFARQARTPLELFQEAMRFPTEALTKLSVETPLRDEGQIAALPGDLYGLAPASSRELPEEVWTIHLEWGLTKARGMSPPQRLGWVGTNLMDRGRIEAAADDAEIVDDAATADMALVDLGAEGALDSIASLAAGGVRTIAYGPHVDDAALREAEAAGAEQALPRSRFFRNLGELLGR